MTRKYGGPSGYGHLIYPTVGVRETGFSNFHTLAPRLGAGPGTGIDLFKLSGSIWVFDQGPTSSCEGHAWSKSIDVALILAGQKPDFIASPKGMYTNGRILGLWNASDVLEDSGSRTSLVEQGVREWGVQAMSNMASDGRYSDCDVSTINDKPKFEDLENEAQDLILGAYVLTSGATLIADMKTCLDNKIPINVAFHVDTRGPRSVERWDPATGPLDVPDFTDPDGGGHIVCVGGYRIDPRTGKTIFRFANSWGSSWGESGYGETTEAWAMAAYEHYAARARPVRT